MSSPQSGERNADKPQIRCDVSFAVACYNAMPYLEAAVASALGQRDATVEVIIVDDGSSDGSLACAQALAAADSRVILLQTPKNSGPGGARNMAIEAMSGTWFAVLDSDDLILPERSATLIARAEDSQADMIADDLIVFGEGLESSRFLQGKWQDHGGRLALDEYFTDAVMYGNAPNPGFLKPMIRKTAIDASGLRYNPDLRIAEDDELIVRALMAGHRYFIHPEPLYKYRKHAQSISHRLSSAHAELMVQSERSLKAMLEAQGRMTPAYRRRWRALIAASAFARSVELVKDRKFARAAAELLRHPSAIPLYAMPVTARIRRLLPGTPK